MEKSLRLIAKLKANLVSNEEVLRAAWREAVGPRIEAHARFRAWFPGKMIVEVDDKVWQAQLEAVLPSICAKLEKVLGEPGPAEILFRIGIPRPMPIRQEAAFVLQAQDPEAARIQNPTQRRIYLESKRQRAKRSA